MSLSVQCAGCGETYTAGPKASQEFRRHPTPILGWCARVGRRVNQHLVVQFNG